MSQPEENIRARWTGDYVEKRDADGSLLERTPKESLPGIPARDLYADEYDALSDEQREFIQRSGLYDVGGADADSVAPSGESAPIASIGRTRRQMSGLSQAVEAASKVSDAETITVAVPDGGAE